MITRTLLPFITPTKLIVSILLAGLLVIFIKRNEPEEKVIPEPIRISSLSESGVLRNSPELKEQLKEVQGGNGLLKIRQGISQDSKELIDQGVKLMLADTQDLDKRNKQGLTELLGETSHGIFLLHQVGQIKASKRLLEALGKVEAHTAYEDTLVAARKRVEGLLTGSKAGSAEEGLHLFFVGSLFRISELQMEGVRALLIVDLKKADAKDLRALSIFQYYHPTSLAQIEALKKAGGSNVEAMAFLKGASVRFEKVEKMKEIMKAREQKKAGQK